MSNWTLQVDADRVAWLTADMAGSSANVLSGDMVRELAAKLTEIAALRPIGAIVQSGKTSGFIAGADIKEFVQIRSPAQGYELVRAGQSVMQQLADLPFPTVAATFVEISAPTTFIPAARPRAKSSDGRTYVQPRALGSS